MVVNQRQNGGPVVEEPEKPIIGIGDEFRSKHSEYQVSSMWVTENTTTVVRLVRDDNARVAKTAMELQQRVVKGSWEKIDDE